MFSGSFVWMNMFFKKLPSLEYNISMAFVHGISKQPVHIILLKLGNGYVDKIRMIACLAII